MLQSLNREDFSQIDNLWVPAFKVEQSQANTGAIEGLQLDKNDQNSFV